MENFGMAGKKLNVSLSGAKAKRFNNIYIVLATGITLTFYLFIESCWAIQEFAPKPFSMPLFQECYYVCLGEKNMRELRLN